MSKNNLAGTSSGLTALALVAAFYGVTAVLARFLSSGLGVFEQWYLRYGIAFIVAIILFRRQINWRKFQHLPKREWQILLFRSLIGGVLAVALYTLAAQHAKIGPVAFMQAVPVLTILAVVFFHEQLTFAKGAFVALSFIGVILVAVQNPRDLASFNLGEVYSLISGALFALFFITRKLHTGALNNQEITALTVGISCLANYLLAVTIYHRLLPPTQHWSTGFTFVLIFAGFAAVANIFLLNYGFERVEGIVASSILNLEQVFGPIFGFIFYRETLTVREIIGGTIIVAAALGMNVLVKSGPPTVVAPD